MKNKYVPADNQKADQELPKKSRKSVFNIFKKSKTKD